MAQIPTITELYNGIRESLETELGITIPTFGKVFLNALAGVQAAKLKLLWLYVAVVYRNVWVDTADPEASGGRLEGFGRVKLGREPFQATQGIYTINVSGDIGATVPAGTIFKSDDTATNAGKLFIADVELVISTQPDTMQIRALEAGPDSRLSVSDTLTSTSPLLNVTDQVVVNSEDEAPLTAESLEDYRRKVIAAFQLESQGGAATDYRIWSADAQGVRIVYPYAVSGECGEIDLFVEANQVDSTDGKGTPPPSMLTNVEEVVEKDPDTTRPDNERGRRPITARQINFTAISPKDVEVTVINPVNIDANTQTSIQNSLKQEIDQIRPFIPAADILANKNDILDINRVISVIQGALSGDQKFDSITMTVDGNPVTTSIQFTDGDIPFLLPIIF